MKKIVISGRLATAVFQFAADHLVYGRTIRLIAIIGLGLCLFAAVAVAWGFIPKADVSFWAILGILPTMVVATTWMTYIFAMCVIIPRCFTVVNDWER